MNDLARAERGTASALLGSMPRARAVIGSMVASVLVLACAGPAASDPGPAALTAPAQGGALAAMTPEARDVVGSASVPFLLLPPPYAEVAVATSGPRWSALSARAGELTVSLHGSDLAHDAQLTLAEVQRAEPTASVRGARARVLVNEGIRSVAWNERGVDWSLEVECFHPDTDARCSEDAFLLDLASRLEEASR